MDFTDAMERLTTAQREALTNAVGESAPNMVMAQGLASEGEAPDWIQLTTGRTFEGRDGRRFKVQSTRAIVKAFEDAGEHLQVDIDHESEFAHPMMGTSTKSYGWVTKLAVRNQGQLWAKVDWTAEGRQLIAEKQYRSISPVFYCDRESVAKYYEDGETAMEVLAVKSVALTNQPNLRVASLNTQQKPAREDDPMNLAKIAAALNLAADADEATILQALSAKPSAPAPDLSTFVPRADYDALASRLVALEANAKRAEDEAAAARKAAHEAKVDAAITEALKAGKIAPASEAYHRIVCQSAEGLSAFSAMVQAAPAIVAPNTATVSHKDPDADGKLPLTEQQKQLAAQMNLTEDQYRAELLSLRQNPMRMRASIKDKE